MKIMHHTVLFIIVLLSGCATTEPVKVVKQNNTATIPVAVIGQDGRVLSGVNIVSLTEASFSISDGKLTCAGSYDPLQKSQTISMPVLCNDGRKGVVRAIRDSYKSGSGTFRLNDGYHGDFVFGKAALNFK
jgi:hypothetical protein